MNSDINPHVVRVLLTEQEIELCLARLERSRGWGGATWDDERAIIDKLREALRLSKIPLATFEAEADRLRAENVRLMAETKNLRIERDGLAGACIQLEDDREYNAGLVNERDVEIARLKQVIKDMADAGDERIGKLLETIRANERANERAERRNQKPGA